MILNDLIELGAGVGRIVHAHFKSQADYEVQTGTTVWPAPERTVAFDRTVRCQRRKILLINRLEEPVRVPVTDDRRSAVRALMLRRVETAIEPAVDAALALHAEAREREDYHDNEDWEHERATDAVIASICRRLV